MINGSWINGTATLLKGLGAKLVLRRCRIPYRSGASLLQPIQAVNVLEV
jgi:hypothetical protein